MTLMYNQDDNFENDHNWNFRIQTYKYQLMHISLIFHPSPTLKITLNYLLQNLLKNIGFCYGISLTIWIQYIDHGLQFLFESP